MTKNKPWYDDLRAIGSQTKAGVDVDLPIRAGQALRAFSPQGSAVDSYGRAMVDDARKRDLENAEDLTGRGVMAQGLMKIGRAVPSVVADTAALYGGVATKIPQAAVLALLASHAGEGYQSTYEDSKAHKDSDAVANAKGVGMGGVDTALGLAGLVGGVGAVSFAPHIAKSAGRAAERGFARLVNESGLATRKYDKFAANKANVIDRKMTVSTQGGQKALPPTAQSKKDMEDLAERIAEVRATWKPATAEPIVEDLTQAFWAVRSRGNAR